MSLVPQADLKERAPSIPDQRTFRWMVTHVVDKGLVTSKGSWGESTNHKVMIVHETSINIKDDSSKYNGKPYLMFTTCNFYYGKKSAKKPVLVDLIEKHEKRPLTDEERGWTDGGMYDLESLIGKTVKGHVETKSSGWQYVSSWQYDVDDDGVPGEPWKKRNDWVTRAERDAQKQIAFDHGANKAPAAEAPANASEFFD